MVVISNNFFFTENQISIPQNGSLASLKVHYSQYTDKIIHHCSYIYHGFVMRGFWRVNSYKSVPSCVEKKSTTSNNILKFPPLYFFHTCFFSASAWTVLYNIKRRKKRWLKFTEHSILTVKINLTTRSVLFYLLTLLFPFFCQRLANF